ncbi:MAG: GNAT family N-acetyltransferase [Aestuariivita sp.]|nr:GNAT family N-acetyltransferase [Aestuariivita sp.]MCY4347226.1 GNAT family N-acetyltransferase [Aestuariivita sp.]
MPSITENISVKIADTPEELEAVFRLRYDVFARELGADGPQINHSKRLERDQFDEFSDHLIAIDNHTREVVGVYRLLRDEKARHAGQFYSENEYDLSVLKNSGRTLLELGRSCLRRDYRGGSVIFHLWQQISTYVEQYSIDVLFGVASFSGTDVERLAEPLSLLNQSYLAPRELRVRTRSAVFQSMDLIDPSLINRQTAMLQVPSLIKAYLRLGGRVGEGAFVDRTFNTTDVCCVLETKSLTFSQRKRYNHYGR